MGEDGTLGSVIGTEVMSYPHTQTHTRTQIDIKLMIKMLTAENNWIHFRPLFVHVLLWRQRVGRDTQCLSLLAGLLFML